MAKGKGGNTVAAVWEIAAPIAEQLGLDIWDIRFVKEGADWFLRIFIDKDGGVGITDCENMSRAIDKPLDEADFLCRCVLRTMSCTTTFTHTCTCCAT